MVARLVKEDYCLAAGEPHQTLIRKGTTVFALTWSAMFDPRVLDEPEEFRPGRPDYHYLHFATGLHACYGRYISRIQIPQILKPLLKLKGLRPIGAPEFDGTFPETFSVAADTDASVSRRQ
jgi:cytochrome P450